ncbi:MAG: zinc-binding dehydrogenase [Actinomycetota bacterium]|nr:zinc-binding dehydrogenase [Actinomycetota bacterium]
MSLLLTNVARYKGAGRMVVSEPLESRREKALEMGATHVINPEEQDAITTVHEMCDGIGADVSFDCFNGMGTLGTAVYSTRRNGRIGILGFGFCESPSYPLMLLAAFASEYTYFATLGYDVEMKEGRAAPRRHREQYNPLRRYDRFIRPLRGQPQEVPEDPDKDRLSEDRDAGGDTDRKGDRDRRPTHHNIQG